MERLARKRVIIPSMIGGTGYLTALAGRLVCPYHTRSVTETVRPHPLPGWRRPRQGSCLTEEEFHPPWRWGPSLGGLVWDTVEILACRVGAIQAWKA